MLYDLTIVLRIPDYLVVQPPFAGVPPELGPDVDASLWLALNTWRGCGGPIATEVTVVPGQRDANHELDCEAAIEDAVSELVRLPGQDFSCFGGDVAAALRPIIADHVAFEVAKAVDAKDAEMREHYRPALVALVKLAKKVPGYHPEDLPYHLRETTGLHVWQAEEFIALAAGEAP